MAKVGLWLRGARGKYAGGVLQKGENGTTLRENVTPKNPQSVEQMAQRIAFGTVTNAAAKMIDIIGLSFEGISDPKMARREFIKVNNAKLRKLVDQYLQSSLPDGQYIALKAKNVGQICPNPYIMSRGSLAMPELIGTSTQVTVNLPWGNTYTAAQLWELLFGLQPGDQITQPYIASRNGADVAVEYQADGLITVNGLQIPVEYDWQRYTVFMAPRIVLKSDTTGQDSLTIPAYSEGVVVPDVDAVQDVLRSIVDMEKTNEIFLESLLEGIGDVTRGDHSVEVLRTPLLFTLLQPSQTWEMMCYCFIVSRYVNGKWTFTNSVMQWNEDFDGDSAGGPAEAPNYTGLCPEVAIYSYVGTGPQGTTDYLTTGTTANVVP